MKDPNNVDSESIAGSINTQRARWVVMFDEVPSPEDEEFIEECILNCTSDGHDKCTNAKRIKGKSSRVELWEFEGTPTNIRTHNERILSGVRSTNTHSEINFEIGFREDEPFSLNLNEYNFPFSSNKSDKLDSTIKIAVLDTGIKTNFIPLEFLWKDDNGYYGKSFIKNGGAIEDDDDNLHGTLVSCCILNQFKEFQDYPVQIMNLKTHDANGKGDLFAIMDAICFAMEQGAAIINASWGFYNKEDIIDSYLKDLITNTLNKAGILFITASGNVNIDIDEGHYFFPAGFGKGIPDDQKNMIVVTTLNKESDKVGERQNTGSHLVDFGVPADITAVFENNVYYMFELPFTKKAEFIDPKSNNVLSVSGTSFATAIATGLIGNFLVDKPRNKKELLDRIGDELFGKNESLAEAINGGRFIKRKSVPNLKA